MPKEVRKYGRFDVLKCFSQNRETRLDQRRSVSPESPKARAGGFLDCGGGDLLFHEDMKIIPFLAVLVALAFFPARAATFHMLHNGQTLQTNPTDFIELTATGTGYIQLKIPGTEEPVTWVGTISGAPSANGTPSPIAAVGRVGSLITGVEWIKPNPGNWCVVKVTPAIETVPATPANVAVIPEDATGQFEVILESSVDMITWSPANPGTYGGNTASRFFRTRIVRK